MEAILIRATDRDVKGQEQLRKLLREHVPADFVEASTVDDLIALLAQEPGCFDLIVFDYLGDDGDTVRAVLRAARGLPVLLLTDLSEGLLGSLPESERIRLERIPRRRYEMALGKAVASLVARGALTIPKTPDLDFLPISTEVLKASIPIRARIYVRLGKDRFVQLMNEEDEFSVEDARIYGIERQVETYYVHRSQCAELLRRQAERVGKLLEKPPVFDEKTSDLAAEALDVVRGAVNRLGFTPEAQLVAKKVAELTLHTISASPRLAGLLKKIRKNEGRFIATHSVSLAEIACAMGYTLGWESSSTLMKLSFSAMAHDLFVPTNELAMIADLYPEKVSALRSDQVEAVQLHPVRSAQYAKSLTAMPPDVDRIVHQHHETGDGSGFPRGLFHTHIHPLSAAFIISHDLLNFLMTQGQSLEDPLAEFLRLGQKRYTSGAFKKIIRQLSAPRDDA